jgi:hypothetical protein
LAISGGVQCPEGAGRAAIGCCKLGISGGVQLPGDGISASRGGTAPPTVAAAAGEGSASRIGTAAADRRR